MAFGPVDSYYLVADIKKRLLAYPKDKASFNGTVLDNLHDKYLYLVGKTGYELPKFKNGSIDSYMGLWEKSGYSLINKIAGEMSVSKPMVDNFLRSIFSAAKNGKIDKRKFDPSFNIIKTSAESLPSEKNLLDNLNSGFNVAGKVGKIVAAVAIIGAVAFIVHDVSKFKR